jgi:hypothetical protein
MVPHVARTASGSPSSGYDPDGDYYRLTRENIGRRVNLALIEESLLIEKALGRVPHTGGERFKADSELCQTLMRWLAAGAPEDPTNVAKAVSLEIMPRQAVLAGKGAAQRFTVRAHYSDGTDRDVTSLAVFLSNNEPTAKVSDRGVVTAGQRGEAFVMARFATFTVGSQVLVVPRDPSYAFPDVPEQNYIDMLVYAKLKKLRLTPSELCDDATFLRRAGCGPRCSWIASRRSPKRRTSSRVCLAARARSRFPTAT